jgi:hypothetical protein
MKRLSLLFTIFVAGYLTAYSPFAYGQDKPIEITAEERAAANELADRFTKRLDEQGDIEPVMKEIFISDFIARQIKEEKQEWAQKNETSGQLFGAPGLEFEPALLDGAPAEDWRQFYVGTFNFLHFGISITMNKMAISFLSGKAPDEKAFDKATAELYPKEVLKLLETNPNLRNFYKKKDSTLTVVKTADDLRSINKTLGEGMKLLRQGDGSKRMKMSPDTIKLMGLLRAKASEELEPQVEVNDREVYGFPKGTRFVRVMASLLRSLLIVKVGAEYKVVDVSIVSK